MKVATGLFFLCASASAAIARDVHQHDMSTGAAMAAPSLKQTGQDAFAAIAEATRVLEADPSTDWSKVKIGALRDHLVDMDNVTTRADVVSTPLTTGARFEVTSNDPKISRSIMRMAHMHSAMASKETPFAIAVQDLRNGVAMTVTSSTAVDAARILGLGFFGLMTEGSHHQKHHLALARGEQMHH